MSRALVWKIVLYLYSTSFNFSQLAQGMRGNYSPAPVVDCFRRKVCRSMFWTPTEVVHDGFRDVNRYRIRTERCSKRFC